MPPPNWKDTPADSHLPNVLALLDQLRPAIAGRDRAAQNALIGQLLTLDAPMQDQWEQLAYLAAGNGELTLARSAMDRFVDAFHGRPSAQFHKVAMLTLVGAWAEADALLRTLPDDVPDPASNAYSRGTAALNLGKREEARNYLEQVTRMRPQSGLAWFSLAMATDFAVEPALADRLTAAELRIEREPSTEQVPYYYALGKMYAERGEHARAFEAYARGAGQMKARGSYNRQEDRAGAARAIEGYNAGRIARIAAGQREATARTIFVTGLPRSGTTLVEQILTSHSAVDGGAEISRLFLLAQDVGDASYSALERYLTKQDPSSAAVLWHHWLDELFPSSGRIVDKTVDTSRFLGLAASLLPEAPLIWMTRDPLDRAWSCFRTNFLGEAMPWSYDLRDIAAHFRIEDQLLAQWRDILGERLLVVPYESLVTEPEEWIRRILAHCGLAEERQVFAPHQNDRAVSTASMMQVRRPINRDGIDAAEPYREFLTPFLEAYYG